MVPAVGLVSLAWVMLCLFPENEAIPNTKTQCCNCNTLMPFNTPSGSSYQVLPSPFKIEVMQQKYMKGNPVNVNLVATEGHMFTSFILGGYKHGSFLYDKEPVGQLEPLNQKFEANKVCVKEKGQPPREENFALTSTDQQPKDFLEFIWKPNKDTNGHVEFRATFIENDKIYWVSEKSEVLQDPNDPEPIRNPELPIKAIDTSECGDTKGCFREPENCNENQCLYVLTWENKGRDEIDFELGGLTDDASDRYVAVGFSDDKYMGDDIVFTCAHNSAGNPPTTEVYASYNQIDPKQNNPIKKYTYDDKDKTREKKSYYDFITSEEGSHRHGRIRCRFTVNTALGNYNKNFNKMLKDINQKSRHLLFARGFASNGAPNDPWMKYEEKPGASADMVVLTSTKDHSGWATYPLAKAHAILMILAWILCNSIGMLLSKYYQRMWPNKRVFNEKYWFMGHASLLSMTFIITIISIIIIFVETGGYSEAPDLALKAHPILGIIILVCIIIIPILALLRPSEPGNCQVIFNWFYWLFCTIANVLAIPNIFIGMDFGKVGVPWWATWILVIWVIFHIAVELTLEIHQCCTHKRNKEKMKKYEQSKLKNPKQPEPEIAGKNFKRFMLSLHVGITILITLIMIIVIAVA